MWSMLGVSLALCTLAAQPTTTVYELRIYHAAPGKMDALLARFRQHTVKLFEKHGITNVGYWVPVDPKDERLIYVVAFSTVEAREKAWKAFSADPEWQRVRAETEKEGRLVTKVESFLMRATDYSPDFKPEKVGERVFELRIYTAEPGRLEALHNRFRHHTMKLFAKHGMVNLAYWSLLPQHPDADRKLIYLLAHKSVEAAKASFEAFGKDPEWLRVRKESEEKAGGPLVVPKTGVVSIFLKPTDFSPWQ
ncbi:MAG: NIPSNAP family protein [Gemmatales bacterium]|nr:NIPSNAP family protein [Gemmatales bacterium]MDW8174646.1 NIPSNAP family protein [Gemmatales bacterium]